MPLSQIQFKKPSPRSPEQQPIQTTCNLFTLTTHHHLHQVTETIKTPKDKLKHITEMLDKNFGREALIVLLSESGHLYRNGVSSIGAFSRTTIPMIENNKLEKVGKRLKMIGGFILDMESKNYDFCELIENITRDESLSQERKSEIAKELKSINQKSNQSHFRSFFSEILIAPNKESLSSEIKMALKYLIETKNYNTYNVEMLTNLKVIIDNSNIIKIPPNVTEKLIKITKISSLQENNTEFFLDKELTFFADYHYKTVINSLKKSLETKGNNENEQLLPQLEFLLKQDLGTYSPHILSIITDLDKKISTTNGKLGSIIKYQTFLNLIKSLKKEKELPTLSRTLSYIIGQNFELKDLSNLLLNSQYYSLSAEEKSKTSFALKAFEKFQAEQIKTISDIFYKITQLALESEAKQVQKLLNEIYDFISNLDEYYKEISSYYTEN